MWTYGQAQTQALRSVGIKAFAANREALRGTDSWCLLTSPATDAEKMGSEQKNGGEYAFRSPHSSNCNMNPSLWHGVVPGKGGRPPAATSELSNTARRPETSVPTTPTSRQQDTLYGAHNVTQLPMGWGVGSRRTLLADSNFRVTSNKKNKHLGAPERASEAHYVTSSSRYALGLLSAQ